MTTSRGRMDIYVSLNGLLVVVVVVVAGISIKVLGAVKLSINDRRRRKSGPINVAPVAARENHLR